MPSDLLHLLPPIRRARGYRLYDHRGRRYLDLWQNGGRTLLGHRSPHLTNLLKDLLSRGLLADLPALQARLLEKALAALLPGFPWVRVVCSTDAALRLASLFLGQELAPEEVYDPALGPVPEGAQAALWRPLLDWPSREGGVRPRVLLPVLPYAAAGAPAAVCFASCPPEGFPPSDPVSPVLLAGAARCLHDLRRYRVPAWQAEGLRAGVRGWRRQGSYLAAEGGEERYAQVFARFLEGGVLLTPRYPGPSLLPAEASPGEAAKMIRLFRENPGE